MHDPYTDLAINSQAQLFILEACRKYNHHLKIVFASTRQIYGKPDYLPVDEKHLLRPIDINGVNKMAGEWFHIIYNNVHGVRASVLRLTNTYGPCMRVKDARQTFLGVWIRLMLEGKSFEVWNGEQLRDFNYTDDVVDAMLITAVRKEAEGQIFNLGGNEIISLKDLADLLVTVNGGGKYSIQKFPEDRQRIDIGNYYSDYTLIQKTLGWSPRISLNDGLRKTLSFYRKYLKHYI
jgi:UDP-glucose 4-epimerase